MAKYCVKNEYSLLAPFKTVDRKIQILLDYNIKPLSILKSLYALDRSERVYVSRLISLMSLNTQDVKVWIFKCADDVFDEYLRKMQQSNRNQAKEMIEAKGKKKIHIENQLNEMLECDDEDAAHIYYNQISHFDQIDSAKQNIEFLRSQGVSLESITTNSAVLAISMGVSYTMICIHFYFIMLARCWNVLIARFLNVVSEELQQKLHFVSNEMNWRNIKDCSLNKMLTNLMKIPFTISAKN